jgi:hypothetical protein
LRASKQAKFLILKQPFSLLLIFLAFFSFNSSHTPQCLTFLQSLASHSEIFNHSEITTVGEGDSCHTVTSGVGHNGHGCVLDCSKQHQPALVPVNTSYETAERLAKLQPSALCFFKILSLSRFFDAEQKQSIVPILETTSPTFSLLSLSRSVRSIVILV